MNPMILAGDIGGTNLRLALFDPIQSPIAPLREEQFPTAGYVSLEAALDHFLGADAGPIAAACFGVAGPVRDGRAELTNIANWHPLEETALGAHLHTEHVALLNDMMAMANGVLVLPPEKFSVLNPGKPGAAGNAAVIAAGTGLGEAFLHWDGRRLVPSPSEGGHADFAPNTALEDELLAWLRARYGHVSYERVLSGPGVFNIYCFLRETRRVHEPEWISARLAQGDPSAVISELAISGTSALCEQAIEIFTRSYGAEAGNMALKGLTTGGVYIGGGIAPKILPMLHQPPFMEGFLNKGRFDDLLESIPIKVILEPHAPLYGAAYYAMQMAN